MHKERLAERIAEKTLRDMVLKKQPRREDVAARKPIKIDLDIGAVVSEELQLLERAANSEDLETLICRYPVRETQALAEIASRLGFQGRTQYENAVRKLLFEDRDSLLFARGLFGTLHADILQTTF